MSSAKDICPTCKTNEKGIKAKQCRACTLKDFSTRARGKKVSKPETNSVVEKETKINTTNKVEEIKKEIQVGDTTPDGKYYL